jgi:hypothetical protein
MTYPFLRPNDTSTGGAPGGGCGGYGSGRGMVANQIPPRARAFPWPLPYSATQGAVGGAGRGSATVSVQRPAYWGPYQPYWPYGVPQQYYNGLGHKICVRL